MQTESALAVRGETRAGAPTGFRKLTPSLLQVDRAAEGFDGLPEGVSVHLACHARARNMGPKAAEMLRLLPQTPVDVIERCAGHGGTFGVLKETHGVAMKVGKPVMRTAVNQARGHIASDCPLAGKHIVQGAEELAEQGGTELPAKKAEHPIEIFARAYGLKENS